MPKELEGIWPYTKADAIEHKTKLRRFYEIGMENMPAGKLEGLSMAEIRARYESGRIRPSFASRHSGTAGHTLYCFIDELPAVSN